MNRRNRLVFISLFFFFAQKKTKKKEKKNKKKKEMEKVVRASEVHIGCAITTRLPIKPTIFINHNPLLDLNFKVN